MGPCRSFRWTYTGLWLVRIWFALYGTGYIHPDEHMQNGEVTAGSILGYHALTTWEWRADLPVRSVLPTFATTGLPMYILRLLFGPVHPSLVFSAQRSAFLCLSGILDYGASRLVPSPARRRLCLLLLASSYVTCTFQVRPFSNSLESALVALCLVLFRRIVDKWTRLKKDTDGQSSPLFHALMRDLHALAALAVAGIFTRPTFIAFTLPIGYQVLRLSYQVAGSPVQAIGMLLLPLCTAVMAASVFIAADTYFFRRDFPKLVITPYNFVNYNLSTKNLADHGLHPNWLHVGVNLPMLLGPLFVWSVWHSAYQYVMPRSRRTHGVQFETDILRQTLVQIIVLSLSALSIQPHQEPRFLTPLVLPIIMLVAMGKFPRPGKLFWASWIAFNVTLALVFGVFHQAGVIPSLLCLHSTLRDAVATGSSTHMVYWKTYMPPRHLLGVSRHDVASGRVAITDLSGASHDELMAAFSASSLKSTYLVTPVPIYLTLPQSISSCMTPTMRLFPHLDLDHIPEAIQAGVYDGLSLGVYVVNLNCITMTADEVGTARIVVP